MQTTKKPAFKQISHSHRWAWQLGLAVLAAGIAETILMGVIYVLIGALPDRWKFPVVPVGLLALGVFIAGLLRFTFRCPVINKNLRDWLKLTPWFPGKDLPFGPVTLTRGELAVLGLCALLSSIALQHVYPILVFLVPYCLMMSCANWKTKSYDSLYFAIFVASLIPLASGWQLLTFGLIAATYAVIQWGYKSALHRFPWDETVDRKLAELNKTASAMEEVWPLVNRGGLRNTELQVPWKHVWAISLLAAWLAAESTYYYTLAPSVRAKHDLPVSIALLSFVFSSTVALFRWFIYSSERHAPLGLRGRIWTGRLIIPGYDKILIAPMLILALGIVGAILCLREVLMPELIVFVNVFTPLALAMGMGPTLAEWNLTGHYRMGQNRPGIAKDWVRL